MRVSEAKPKSANLVLPDADFSDAWQIRNLAPGQDARTIAAAMRPATANWIKALMGVRNFLVRPFGLKTEIEDTRETPFPVISSEPRRVVLGLDDKHLDFRFVIEVDAVDRMPAATATTYVRTHNPGGRVYLAMVKPFHRVIVPAMLKSAVVTQ